ncbi:MAG: GntR family transcriptional regulator [Victivallales bacterium]|nr:GntR family transcriptional regulator [Victivallales bacterium]
MTLLVLKKLNIKKNLKMPVYQHLAEQITKEIKSGKLNAGDKLPTEHCLAKELGINRLTVRKSYQTLEYNNLVERRRGMGTFILKPSINNNHVSNHNKTIYVLIPHPVHITLQLQSSLLIRRIIYGASMEKGDNLIQTVPVSKRFTGRSPNVDWNIIRQIPEKARVFVSSMWFGSIFPFLLERDVQAILMNDQYINDMQTKEYELIKGKWNIITRDRLSAMEQAVLYLYNQGRRKIATIKKYKNETNHPFKKAMISVHEEYSINYSNDQYCEIGENSSQTHIENEIVELWNKTKFDSLIVCSVNFIKTVYNTLTKKLGLKIPEDVALMSFYDNPVYLDFESPITAIDFPSTNIGREIIKIFDRKSVISSESIFQATIIERESTRKGAGAYINHTFMPEISVNNNIINMD